MKYIICSSPGKLELKEKQPPVRKEGEALLKINKVGICGTDLHAYAGDQAFFTYPRILGHELASTVLEIDNDEKNNPQNIKVGDSVIVLPYISDKNSAASRSGKPNCCPNISVIGVHQDGGMQEQISVRSDILLPAGDLSDDEMCIVEPLAIGAHAIRRANVREGEFIVVVGCGPIGIGIMKFGQVAGAKVIAIDVNEDRLKYAKDEIGVDYVINATTDSKVDPIEKVFEITSGDMAPAVFDATGQKQALEAGINYMSHGGSYVLVGLSKGDLVFNHPQIHAKEATIMCSRNATKKDFEHVIDCLNKKMFPTSSYITHNVDMGAMIENFDLWLKPETGVIKATVNF